MRHLFKLLAKHPVVTATGVAAVTAGGAAAYEYEGERSGRPWPPSGIRGSVAKLGAEVLKLLRVKSPGAAAQPIPATGSYPGSVPSTPPPASPVGGTPTGSSYKYTIDLSSLPAKSQRGSISRLSTAYKRWAADALNAVDSAGLPTTGAVPASAFRTAAAAFQASVGPAPGLSADGIVGAQTEDALLQILSSLPRPPGYTGTR